MTAVAVGGNPVHEIVLDALSALTPLRISGRSHWMDAMRPVAATRIASLAPHSGIVDYVPGDLTITVRAGTTLREIDEVTRSHNQWLPLDPFGSRDGTIGATIATGSFGPLAHAFGRARDLVLGLEFVSGEGKIARGGGRVVKNVAGFDLVRLLTGSWGTLGIITEATLRLYSRPSAEITLSLGASDSATALAQRIASVLAAPGIPFAVELVDAPTAAQLGLSNKQQILVRLGGNAAAVAAQGAAIDSLGGAKEIDPEIWTALREIERAVDAAAVVRLSALPQRLAELWTRASERRIDGMMMHATPSLGIIRCVIRSGSAEQIAALAASSANVTAIYERLPRQMWSALSPSIVADRISQRMKSAFDPMNIMNPGILGPQS